MTNYNEEQNTELEALESIYPDEFCLLQQDPFPQFKVSVKTTDYEENSDGGAFCSLHFTFVERYPDEPPVIEVTDAVNIDEDVVQELTSYLIKLAEENLHMVMVFTLVSCAQEWLATKAEEIKVYRVKENERKQQEAEEAERKKFEGTRVTVESFLSWKAKFDTEITARKNELRKNESGPKKLTGRELFETDHTLNESDIRFLQEGEEEVKVDESLFQDLDDLDIDDLEEDDDDDDAR